MKLMKSTLAITALTLSASNAFAGGGFANPNPDFLGVYTPEQATASALQPLSATVQFEEADFDADRLTKVVVKATFQASNACSAPMPNEIVAIQNFDVEGKISVNVGAIPTNRRCNRLFAPVTYEVVVLSQDYFKSFAEGNSYEVNGVKATVYK